MRWLTEKRVGGKPFEHPKVEGDAISRYLDSITLEQHYMEQFGLSRETVRTFLSPVEGGGSGLGPDALSAYSEYAFEMLRPLADEAGGTDQMFPGGNTTIARLMVKSLIPAALDGPNTVDGVTRNNVNFAALDAATSPARIRLSSTALSVEHDGDPQKAASLSIAYLKDGKVYRVKARSAVMAGGSWTTKHIVKDLPATHAKAYAQFYRSPCLMANVAVRNWNFLYKMGMSGCRWFEGVGNYMEVRKLATTGIDEPYDPSGLADRFNAEGVVLLSGAFDGGPGAPRPWRNAEHVVRRLRAAHPRTVHRHVRGFRIRCAARHRRHYPEPLGTCVS